LYSDTPGCAAGTVLITPACSSSFNRFDRRVGDISGRPRRRSLKRVEPHNISRTIRAVQREQITSAAIATGQNCP
jgi:hypothetical protein